jgi:hypothetical protein
MILVCNLFGFSMNYDLNGYLKHLKDVTTFAKSGGICLEPFNLGTAKCVSSIMDIISIVHQYDHSILQQHNLGNVHKHEPKKSLLIKA